MSCLLASYSTHVVTDALLLTIQVSLVAVLLSLAPAVLLATWLAHTRNRARLFVEGILACPLVVPPVVIGLILLHVMLLLPVDLAFTWQGAAIASAVVGFPLLVRTVRTTVEGLDDRLYIVAATLGASRGRMLFTITLPLAWRGIVAGTLLAWGRAAGEFGATIVVAGNMRGSTQTLPLAIWSDFQAGADARMWIMAGLAVAISFVAVLLSEWLTAKGRRSTRRRPGD